MAIVTLNQPTPPKPEFQNAMAYPAGTLCVDEVGDAVIVIKLPISAMLAYKRASRETPHFSNFHFEMEHRQRFLRLKDGVTGPCGVKARKLRDDESPLTLKNAE